MKNQKETNVKLDGLRSKAVEKFFELSDKMIKHITWSMEATIPCPHCSIKDGNHVPGKAIDSNGNCAMCHKTYVIPDKQQRNWAIEQAQPVIAPAPKTIEVNVDQSSNVPELADVAKKLTKEELENRLKIISLSVEEADSVSKNGTR